MRDRRFVLGAVLAALAALPARAWVPNDCEAISAAEIESLTGLKVLKVAHVAVPKLAPHAKSTCHFSMGTADTGPKPRTIVQFTERPDAAAMKEWFEANVRGGSSGRRAEKVEGVGDQAYWIGEPIQQLFTRKDRFAVTVQVVRGATEDAELEQATRVARAVLPRLKP